jgi:hypothetical protein
MTTTSLEFFALADEQRQWVRKVLEDSRVWSALWQPGKGKPTFPLDAEFVDSFTFAGRQEYDFMFFLGHRDLSNEPIWRTTPRGMLEIDFLASRVVQFVPSLTVGVKTLLDGRLAIMPHEYYKEARIDDRPLREWFRLIAGSFGQLRSTGSCAIHRSKEGNVTRYANYVLTRGAVMWRQQGGLLKHSPDAAVEFDIEGV